jgi:hypothetical protein
MFVGKIRLLINAEIIETYDGGVWHPRTKGLEDSLARAKISHKSHTIHGTDAPPWAVYEAVVQRRETKWNTGGRLKVRGHEMASSSGSLGAGFHSKDRTKHSFLRLSI